MTDESDVFCFRVLSIIHFGIDWCCNSFGCRAIPCHTPIWWTIASQGKWPWWRCCHWIPLPSWWTGRCLSQSCRANENWSTTSVLVAGQRSHFWGDSFRFKGYISFVVVYAICFSMISLRIGVPIQVALQHATMSHALNPRAAAGNWPEHLMFCFLTHVDAWPWRLISKSTRIFLWRAMIVWDSADAAPASPNAREQRLGIALFMALFGLRLFPELPRAGTVRWPPMLWTGEGWTCWNGRGGRRL